MALTPKDQASELRMLMASSGGAVRTADPALSESVRTADPALSESVRTADPTPEMVRTADPTPKMVRTADSISTMVPPRAADGPARRHRRAARVVAIASGKGGVGKTNIAVNLALSLAARGRRVVLVDADLGTANIDVVMNVQAPFNLSHVLRGERTIDEVAVPITAGLWLIAGASGLASAADLSPLDRQALVGELGRLESHADILLLDCGAGISQNVLAFAQSTDELLLVTTPEPTALTDAYALAKVLSRAPRTPPMALIVNQSKTLREGQLVGRRIASVAARFLGVSLSPTGPILCDRHVAMAVRQRVPFVLKYPRSPASTCIAALATRMDRGAPGRIARPDFFRRVMRFFY